MQKCEQYVITMLFKQFLCPVKLGPMDYFVSYSPVKNISVSLDFKQQTRRCVTIPVPVPDINPGHDHG